MFRFIDLFCGIGGMRLAGEASGGRCVFSSEINDPACRTYEANFGDAPRGDITAIPSSDIPPHDVLFAGFPCQPFSISGKQLGFADTRGTLFFEIARIAADLKPSVLILENVKFLTVHDGGRTLGVIVSTLQGLGYHVTWELLNANRFGLPQSRDRILIVASLGGAFVFPPSWSRRVQTPFSGILEEEGPFEFLEEAEYTLLPPERIREQPSGLIFCGYRNKNIRLAGVREGTEHLSRVHKQPNRIYRSDGTHPTLSSQETSGRYFILHKGRVRKLTLRECFRLQGFPEDYKRHGPSTQQYRMVGNSVPVPMITEIAGLATSGLSGARAMAA